MSKCLRRAAALPEHHDQAHNLVFQLPLTASWKIQRQMIDHLEGGSMMSLVIVTASMQIQNKLWCKLLENLRDVCVMSCSSLIRIWRLRRMSLRPD